MKRPAFYRFGPPPRKRSNLLKIGLQCGLKIIVVRASTERVLRGRCSDRRQGSGITSQDPASVGASFGSSEAFDAAYWHEAGWAASSRELFFESSSRSIFLFEHDLRANAFRVCREGKPIPTLGSSPRACFSGSCSHGRKADMLYLLL
jgi:hypothetical protein